ncbi:unnamed protein product [Amoebophrya sp. A120]|nr:unnamed protein product [Amoebophrya sp. A120]|eukprot:GSA120T00011976001.1
MATLEWRNLTVSLKGPRHDTEPHFCLKNASGQVRAGETLAIMGPSGSGKTTLISILSGLFKKLNNVDASGEIRVSSPSSASTPASAVQHPSRTGEEIVEGKHKVTDNDHDDTSTSSRISASRSSSSRKQTSKRRSSAFKLGGIDTFEDWTPVELHAMSKNVRRMGIVEQLDVFSSSLTVCEHLMFHAKLCLHDVPDEEKESRVLYVMERLKLNHRRNTRVLSLSGGEKKRVSIAEELLHEPDILFLDEPTSMLDSTMAREVMSVLFDPCHVKDVTTNIYEHGSLPEDNLQGSWAASGEQGFYAAAGDDFLGFGEDEANDPEIGRDNYEDERLFHESHFSFRADGAEADIISDVQNESDTATAAGVQIDASAAAGAAPAPRDMQYHDHRNSYQLRNRRATSMGKSLDAKWFLEMEEQEAMKMRKTRILANKDQRRKFQTGTTTPKNYNYTSDEQTQNANVNSSASSPFQRRKKTTIIFTVHQPSCLLYSWFTDVMFLARGRVVYSGKGSEAVASLEQALGVLVKKCKVGYSAPEFILDTISNEKCVEKILAYNDTRAASTRVENEQNMKSRLTGTASRGSTTSATTSGVRSHQEQTIAAAVGTSTYSSEAASTTRSTASKFEPLEKYPRASWCTEFSALYSRNFMDRWRNPIEMRIWIIGTSILLLIMSVIYWRVGTLPDSQGARQAGLNLFLSLPMIQETYRYIYAVILLTGQVEREYGVKKLYRLSAWFVARRTGTLLFDCTTLWLCFSRSASFPTT